MVVHRVGADREAPARYREVLRWRPWPGAPEAVFDASELLRGVEG